MKKNQEIKSAFYIVVIFVLLFLMAISSASAQTSQNISIHSADKLVFLSGDIKEGKVIAFENEKIKFSHCNETLEYEFSKKEIEKIEFASGRTELINDKKIIVPVVPVKSANRVAILPVVYAGNDNPERAGYMRSYLQQMMIDYLSKSAAALKFVDANDINTQLLKAGITEINIRQYTPKELASLLHVEYILTGSVLQTTKKQIRQTNRTSDRKQSGKSNSHTTETSMPDIETEVSLVIYNETGDKVYSKSRQSILSDPDAYKNAIKYLLKRTPLHNR